ncbi:MAG: hypothetical protein U9R52_02185 [Candidatus Omnitrophota bacterium]|nr:hypothetical protein [Candidatus Omnitrophota bacterium]
MPQLVRNIYAEDRKKLSDDIIMNYKGKVISIERLNSATCWAVLSPELTNTQIVEIAENIGHYIRNATGEKLTVRVFVNGTHAALARPSGKKYIASLKK